MCSIGWWLRTGPMRGCAGCRPETSSSPFCTGNWPLRRACATSKPARQPCAPALPPRRSGDIALDPRRRQCQAPERGVRRAVRSSGRAGRSRPAAQVGEAVHLIDFDGVAIERSQRRLARFSDGVCGAKLHIVYDCDAERPIDAAITPSQRHHRRPGSADCSGRDLRL